MPIRDHGSVPGTISAHYQLPPPPPPKPPPEKPSPIPLPLGAEKIAGPMLNVIALMESENKLGLSVLNSPVVIYHSGGF